MQPTSPPPPQNPYPAPTGEISEPLRTLEPPRKRFHQRAATIAAIIAICVGLLLLGIVGWMLLRPKPVVKEQAEVAEPVVTLKPYSASDTIKDVSKMMKVTGTAQSGLDVPFKTKNHAFYTVNHDMAAMQSAVSIVSVDEAAKAEKTLSQFLRDHSYHETIANYGSSTTAFDAYYTREDTACQVTIGAADATTKKRQVDVKCLDGKHYDQLAVAQSPFYQVYGPASANSYEVAVIDGPKVSAGSWTNHQNAEIAVSSIADGLMTQRNNTALFYQTGSGQWFYVTDTQGQAALCTTFNTSVLKGAFHGRECRDVQRGRMMTVVAPKQPAQ